MKLLEKLEGWSKLEKYDTRNFILTCFYLRIKDILYLKGHVTFFVKKYMQARSMQIK